MLLQPPEPETVTAGLAWAPILSVLIGVSLTIIVQFVAGMIDGGNKDRRP